MMMIMFAMITPERDTLTEVVAVAEAIEVTIGVAIDDLIAMNLMAGNHITTMRIFEKIAKLAVLKEVNSKFGF